MDAITSNYWFWPGVVIAAMLGITVLVVREAVEGYRRAGPIQQQGGSYRLYVAAMLFVPSLFMGYLGDQPWYVPVAVGAWLGVNAAFAPRTVSYASALRLLGQMGGSAALLLGVHVFLMLH
jgi:hypothetical protein